MEFGRQDISNWVTWGSWSANDPLFTAGVPIEPNCLDYVSYSSYSYDPERMRDYQLGPTTGTSYQGYLAALKECYPNKPLVISETGLADNKSPEDIGDHARLHPWYPAYRKGGLTSEQVAEGLADRYWDARLLQDDNDPKIVIGGIATFEWNDEWHKYKNGDPSFQEDKPEEHFGLGRFEKSPAGSGYQLRYKMQQEVVRYLYRLKFDRNTQIIEDVIADNNSLRIGESTLVHAILSDSLARPVRYRWETNRGYIIGDSNTVEFYAGNNALGPAKVTVVAIDANSNANFTSTLINIEISEPNKIETLTLGTQRASGRVYNVNLDKYKLVCYLQLNWIPELWAKPYFEMKSIWIDKGGFWWTVVQRNPDEKLSCWLVDRSWPELDIMPVGSTPPNPIAEAKMSQTNDWDNDLLQDNLERQYFDTISKFGRYDDPDGDMCNNLEEFLRGMNPNDPNDGDKDGLWDNWEYHYFGDIHLFDANDDPDRDGLTNLQEQNPNLGTHPGRASQDTDSDGLPDLWEISWFNTLEQGTQDDPDNDGLNNILEYELGLPPI